MDFCPNPTDYPANTDNYPLRLARPKTATLIRLDNSILKASGIKGDVTHPPLRRGKAAISRGRYTRHRGEAAVFRGRYTD
jgi:hypothetical protein